MAKFMIHYASGQPEEFEADDVAVNNNFVVFYGPADENYDRAKLAIIPEYVLGRKGVRRVKDGPD